MKMNKLLFLLAMVGYPLLNKAMSNEPVYLEDALPKEIQHQILLSVVEGKTAKDAISNIKNFGLTNKNLASFLSDEYTNKLIIQKLAEKYYNGDALKASLALNTPGARLWLANYLAEENRAKEARNPLFKSLYANDKTNVENLINAGLNVNIKDSKLERTALMVAAQNGNLDLLNFLFSKGANINQRDRQGLTPLMYAIRSGKMDAVKWLIQKGASIELTDNRGFTPLMMSIDRKQPIIAKFLIENNAQINAKDKVGATALLFAADSGLPEIASLLIQKGADINAHDKTGWSVIIAASSTKDGTETLKQLLQAGVNPSAVTSQNITTIYAAALSKNPENVKLLLNTPAREFINIKSVFGSSPLHMAIFFKDPEITKLLLEAGADVNDIDNNGWTPLFEAVHYNQPAIVKQLKNAGADTQKVVNGQTALEYAQQQGFQEIVNELQN